MKYIFDYSKLKGRTKELGLTQENIADKVAMSSGTYSQKINNNSEFTQKEIQDICNVLNIPLSDIPIYFFTPKV